MSKALTDLAVLVAVVAFIAAGFWLYARKKK